MSADLEALRAEAGLASDALTAKMGPGAVFIVDTVLADRVHLDVVVRYPEGELHKTSTPRETRRVVVVQTEAYCRAGNLATVLVVPCSASHRGPVKPWQYQIPSTEQGFDKPSVAYPSLVQPVLKRRLIDFKGQLTSDALGEIIARLRLMIGTSDAALGRTSGSLLTLPPRTK